MKRAAWRNLVLFCAVAAGLTLGPAADAHRGDGVFRLVSGLAGDFRGTTDGGLLEIFRGRPGFQSYELIETGAGLVSVSHWESSEQADAATHAAAAWVADHIDDLVKLQQSDTGEVVLSSPAAASTR